MNNHEEKIPPFVQDYLDKMEYEGYPDFVNLSRKYHKEREEYPGKHAVQSAQLNNLNRTTDNNKSLNYEDGLTRIDLNYKKEAFETAKKHGYKGPDPNQPSDKEFTKQGEKFNGMIEQSKQRQQEQTKQIGQQQEATESHEKKNIDTLKEQQPYQQNKPTVEFKGIEQPSGTDEQNREQQRAAFLEQVKKIRDVQTQRQQYKQTEI